MIITCQIMLGIVEDQKKCFTCYQLGNIKTAASGGGSNSSWLLPASASLCAFVGGAVSRESVAIYCGITLLDAAGYHAETN